MKKTLALLLLLAGLSAGAQGRTLTWNGSEGHMTWNFEDDNWLQGDTPAQYIDGNDVVFGYTGCGTVTLSDTLEPASVKVGPSNDYTFTGDGKLTGKMKLTIDNCNLTVNTANDYTGGTIIKPGSTLVVGNDKALGTGAVTLDRAATLDLGGHVLSNDVVTVTSSGNICCIGNGTLNGNISLASNTILQLIGNLSGTGRITLGDNMVLDLGGYTLSNSVTLQGSATFLGDGTLSGDLTVGEGLTFRLDNPEIVSGTIYLGKKSTLDLRGNTLNTNVVLTRGAATITAGTLNGNISVSVDKFLHLGGDLKGAGTIVLEDFGYLYLEGHTLSTHVAIQGSKAYIGGGTLNGDLYVRAGARLELVYDNVQGSGVITLGDNATLQLGGIINLTLSNRVILEGSATIGYGTLDGSISVGANNKLTLLKNTTITGAINLGDHAALDLGGNTFHLDGEDGNKLVLNDSISAIGNGTIEGSISVGANNKLTLLENTTITGAINLGDHAALDLGGNTFHQGGAFGNRVDFAGDATIGNGTVEGNLTVAVGKSLALLAGTTITGGVNLGDSASLDLGGNTFHTGGDACNRVTFSGGTTVSNGKLVLGEALSSAFTLNGVTLDLGGLTLSKAVTLVGNNAIGNGTLNTNLNVGEGNTLTLCGNLDGQQNQDDKITLGNNATLDLNNHSISKYCYVKINGDAFIGNGSFYSEVVVAADKKLTLCGNLWSSGWFMGSIILYNNATLDLGKHTYSGLLSMKGDTATIGNGTLERDLSVGDGKTLNLCGDLGGSGSISMSGSATLNIGTHTLSKNVTLNGTSTVKAENTTIKALNTDKEGLLKELSVSDGLIAGTDRQASLADGLDINRMGYDLTLENLVLTANNSISVGNGHSITLNNVTIKLSQAHYELVDGSYYFNLKTLINCDLDMDTVTFDASGLSLGTAMEKVVFDFGEDVTIDPQTAKNLTLLMGNYLSTSANLDTPGQVLFTALVPTPEPTTGTLSLLALAALAARRRK